MKALPPKLVDERVQTILLAQKKKKSFIKFSNKQLARDLCGCNKQLARDLCDAAMHVVAKKCLLPEQMTPALKEKVSKYAAKRHVCSHIDCSFSTMYASSIVRHSRTCKHVNSNKS